MGALFQSVFQVFFLFGYIILYVVSIIILKPFRVHRRRKKSTISLKLTYIVFLFFFLVFTYLLLFGEKILNEEDQPYDTIFNIHFLFFLSATIVPNVGIMVRRRIKKNRVEYNILFTVVNVLYVFYLLFLISSGKWALL